jgi:ADP-heptose:LPS heptosyltransferase
VDRLIGISWWSRTKRKDLPEVADWAPLLRWKEAAIVSLQHGDIKHDLEVLQDLAGGRVIQDAEIDQLTDLDGFAAQIAALDAVVSISNTTIDMAGMLGVPTVHLRDDKYSPFWPPSGPSSWYPGMVFLYRQNRPWSDALAESAIQVEQMVSTAAV